MQRIMCYTVRKILIVEYFMLFDIMINFFFLKCSQFDRMIRNTAASRHHQASKQIEASFPKTVHAQGEIYDQVGANSAYEELGELSKPTVYEKLN